MLLLLRLAGVVSRASPWLAKETNATLTRAFCPQFVALAGSTAYLSHLHRVLQSQPGEIPQSIYVRKEVRMLATSYLTMPFISYM